MALRISLAIAIAAAVLIGGSLAAYGSARASLEAASCGDEGSGPPAASFYDGLRRVERLSTLPWLAAPPLRRQRRRRKRARGPSRRRVTQPATQRSRERGVRAISGWRRGQVNRPRSGHGTRSSTPTWARRSVSPGARGRRGCRGKGTTARRVPGVFCRQRLVPRTDRPHGWVGDGMGRAAAKGVVRRRIRATRRLKVSIRTR